MGGADVSSRRPSPEIGSVTDYVRTFCGKPGGYQGAILLIHSDPNTGLIDSGLWLAKCISTNVQIEDSLSQHASSLGRRHARRLVGAENDIHSDPHTHLSRDNGSRRHRPCCSWIRFAKREEPRDACTDVFVAARG